MPQDTIIVVAGIISAFIIFGVTLAWAEYRTRNVR
jgi:hypothetical protein